jgi:hypothetical protein
MQSKRDLSTCMRDGMLYGTTLQYPSLRSGGIKYNNKKNNIKNTKKIERKRDKDSVIFFDGRLRK